MVIHDILLLPAGYVVIVRTTGSYRLKSDLRFSLLRMKLPYKLLGACIHKIVQQCSESIRVSKLLSDKQRITEWK